MKKSKLILVLLFLFSLSIFVGCAKPKYIVSFDVDGGQSIASQEVIENEKAIKPTSPIKEGYEFIGWFNGDVEYEFDQPVLSDISLKAKWNICTYVITFDTGTNESIESQKIEYNKKVLKPSDPIKEGYIFSGWYKNDKKYDFNTLVKEDFLLVAKWKEIPNYYLTFYVDGEVIDIIEVENGKDGTAPAAPSIEGKNFIKWEGDITNVTEDRDIIAIYETIKLIVEFRVDGVLYQDTIEVEYGKDCVAPSDPVKEGYKFIGWDKDFTVVKENLIINAVFETLAYTIKYYSGDKEITNLDPVSYTPEETIILPEYNMNGYYFYGWYKNSDYSGEVVYCIEQGSSENIILYALNVKKDNNGGTDLWNVDFPSSHDPSNGIDEISNLPEQFELDFYRYLKVNNLLTSESINVSCQAASWDVFSGVNPIHNGDPKRIWNDTSSNASGSADGYASVFLYETIELNEDLTVRDVKGGFLGTEPYKTKYRGLLDILMVMYQHKVENNNYTDISASTNSSRALLAFVIDGYFYGTQGAGSDYLLSARSVIPGINYSYKLSGSKVEKIEYNNTKIFSPVKDGFAFAGWFLDKECTKAIEDNKPTNLCTLYAKWEEIK